MNLEHVNLTVTDLDRSVSFYCNLLDAHVRWKGTIDGERLGAHVGDDRCYLALFQAATDGEVGHDYSRPGLNHFGFVVDDLDEARRRLDRLGATVHWEADYHPGRRIYFFDPDGHEVELVEY
ncbi:MAG: VOC family protein [Actinomycetota bacterium]|jgi:catechol 2,3-dioxygenase-like lactoylglutathione lyase family enzyme